MSLISDFLALTRKAKQRSSQGDLASGELGELCSEAAWTLAAGCVPENSPPVAWNLGTTPGSLDAEAAQYAHAQSSLRHLPESSAPLGLVDEAGPRPPGHLPGASGALQCHGPGGLNGSNHLTPHGPAVLIKELGAVCANTVPRCLLSDASRVRPRMSSEISRDLDTRFRDIRLWREDITEWDGCRQRCPPESAHR